MGIMGFLSFAVIVWCIIREAMRAARRVARREAEVSSLAFWTGAIIILGSASFGVVLEGPMGGILFWSFLGLASSQLHEEKQSNSKADVEDTKVSRKPAPQLATA